jgi:general secretion pathway protein E
MARAAISAGKGCEKCLDTGYMGRLGVFEIMPVTEKLKGVILSTSDANAVKKAAVSEGMRTLRLEGADKVIRGVSTPEEILRVTQI